MTNKELTEVVKEHNTRLTTLEKWRWLLTGALLMLSAENIPVLQDVLLQTIALVPHALAFAGK